MRLTTEGAPVSDPAGAAPSRIMLETPWYKLFSRGARDWLRHNQKVRDTVRSALPEMLSGPDLLSQPTSERTVKVPVRLLEHARFRLRDADQKTGAGQGAGEDGQVLRPGQEQTGEERGGGGDNKGEIRFVLELKIDDVLDWLWEELKLPDLKPKHSASVEDPEYVREGLDRRGPRARLDRRRTVKEAVKRRAIQDNAVPFSNDDLRFRQLVRRTQPALNAVVIFALDVSGSMQEAQRKLAKMFFFFALHGIRRQYQKVEIVFVAHTDEAWEFNEEQFFQVTGGGGTHCSSAFQKANEILRSRFDPSRYNAFLFYASDGENAYDDHDAASAALNEMAPALNYAGYVEVTPQGATMMQTEITALFSELKRRGLPAAAMPVSAPEDVWRAITHFFTEQANAAEK
jgi:uncharacterized sporulation protein YeaH/YhbH (DUF444 family)